MQIYVEVFINFVSLRSCISKFKFNEFLAFPLLSWNIESLLSVSCFDPLKTRCVNPFDSISLKLLRKLKKFRYNLQPYLSGFRLPLIATMSTTNFTDNKRLI